MIKIICLFITGLLAHGILYSQSIITDRPDQTESSSTIPRGSLQIESGVLIGHTGSESVRQILAPSTLFRIGLFKGLELRVVNQFESIRNKKLSEKTHGISDLEIGTKIQLFKNENVNTEVAFLSHVVFPTGSEGLSNDDIGMINKLSIAHDLSDRSSVGYNIGYDYFNIGNGNMTYSVALGFAISDQVGIYLEPYGQLVDLKDHEASFDAGITYLLRDNLQLDFSFGTGLNYKMNYLSMGVSWNIARR